MFVVFVCIHCMCVCVFKERMICLSSVFDTAQLKPVLTWALMNINEVAMKQTPQFHRFNGVSCNRIHATRWRHPLKHSSRSLSTRQFSTVRPHVASVCVLSQWTRAWSNSTTVTRTSFVFSSRISVLNVALVSAGRGWRKHRSAFPTPSPTVTKSHALFSWRRQKTMCSGTTIKMMWWKFLTLLNRDCPRVEIHWAVSWTDAVLLAGTLMAALIYTQELLTQTVCHFNMEKRYSSI